MKASNKFRMTHTFVLLSGTAREIGIIAAKYGKRLISVAHQHEPKGDHVSRHSYVLRILEERNLIDLAVYVDSGDAVIEVERVIVIEAAPLAVAPAPDFSYKGDTLTAHSPAARQWVEKNFMPDHSYHGNAHIVDPSYITPIIQKIEAAGLRFSFV